MISELTDAIDAIFEAKTILARAKEGYDGYSFGYHYSREYESLTRAEAEFEKQLLAVIDERIKQALTK